MPTARYVRRLQFDSGPQTCLFYACEDCAGLLSGRGGVLCFSPLPNEPMQNVNWLDDDIDCELCKEPDPDYEP